MARQYLTKDSPEQALEAGRKLNVYKGFSGAVIVATTNCVVGCDNFDMLLGYVASIQ